jgi:hypothetical protein
MKDQYYGLANLDYYCEAQESHEGNLVIRMVRRIEQLPFTTEYHITKDMLGLSDKDFCHVNKIFNHVLRQISFSLHKYIRAKLETK